MFFNADLDAHLGQGEERITTFLEDGLARLFHEFPDIAGIVSRFGETDGRDVRGDFCSRLVIRTSAQMRRMISRLLSVCERHARLLIVRTWSVGAYRVGDLMWNRDTFERVFADLHSDRLIISMKYGESDFFRYLPLNRQFLQTSHRKIIELQARREYEGFGAYPSFVGIDYEVYRDQLREAKNVVGISVWCQTGGWGVFKNLTYLQDSSIWNEINTEVTLSIFRDRLTAEGAIRKLFLERWGPGRWDWLIELLRLSDEVVKELLYVEEFSRRRMYFRRLRIPPMPSAYWDQVVVNHAMRKILRCFVHDGERCIQQGVRALAKIRRMAELAQRLGLPTDGIEFQYDTFRILAAAREYYFRPFTLERAEKLRALRAAYCAQYPVKYSVHMDFEPLGMRRATVRRVLSLLLRHGRAYRMVDRLVTLRFFSLLYALSRPWRKRFVPSFAGSRAMGLDAVFR